MPRNHLEEGRYRFCPLCGTSLQPFRDRDQQRFRCPSCGWIHYRNPTAGVAVILLCDGKLLLGKRDAGGWCIPCGHVEWGESVEEAAIREMREEIGLEVDLTRVYAVHSNFHDPSNHTVGIWYLGTTKSFEGARAGGDLTEVRFFPLAELPALVYPTDRIVTQKLQADFPSEHGPHDTKSPLGKA